jgi:hypothetical protein
MARAAAIVALVAAVAFAAAIAPAQANAQLCTPGLTPAQPTNVRVKSNVWNGKNAGEFWFVLRWPRAGHGGKRRGGRGAGDAEEDGGAAARARAGTIAP